LYKNDGAADVPERTLETLPSAPLGSARSNTGATSFFAVDADHHAADPVIARFRAALQNVQTNELERLYNRLPELDEHSRRVIWQFADCLVEKVLHPPLECLRDESRHGYPHRLLNALQRLFRLSD
jgi:glutamyl-tRNA reductase